MKSKSLTTSICSGYNWLERQGSKLSTLWLIWGVYTLIVIVFAWRHEPWYDEYHAWGMVNRMDFIQLWNAMRKEGHFIFWHMCLWPFVKWFGMDWRALYCVSVPLMSLAAWLLLFRVRFPFFGKLLVVFSAPFFYFYAVIARCYALIPPILMGLASLYQQKKRPVLYCLLLGLLANTHAYIEGLVGILWCLFVYKEVWQEWKKHPQKAKCNLMAAMLTLLFVLIALLQVIGGLVDVSQGHNPPGEGINSAEQWLTVFYGGYHILFFDWLHSRVSYLIPNLDLVITLFCYIILIICIYKTIISDGKKKEWLLLLFCGLGWQIFFATNLYGMNWHRIGMLYFVLVFVFLLYGQKAKYLIVCLSVLWLLNTQQNYKIVKDLWRTYDMSIYWAKDIEELIPNNAILFSNTFELNDLIQVSKSKIWNVDVQQQIEKTSNIDCWLLTYYGSVETTGLTNAGCSVDTVYSNCCYNLYHIIK